LIFAKEVEGALPKRNEKFLKQESIEYCLIIWHLEILLANLRQKRFLAALTPIRARTFGYAVHQTAA